MDLKTDLEEAAASPMLTFKERSANLKAKLIKYKKPIVLTAVTLFVASNLALIYSADSKAARTSYVTSWTKAEKQTLRETLQTDGVVTPEKEHYVYYNDNPGEFKEFLVEKGDIVRRGTPLYEFSSKNVDTDKQKLEFEKNQLVREANIIDEHIQQLLYLQSVSNSASNNGGTTGGETGSGSTPATGEIVTVSIEKEIYDKQLEKGRILNEIKKYDELINSMNNGDQLGIHSDVEGVVKEINYELKNPVMTIISKTPQIEGRLTQEELKIVEEGMHVEIISDLHEEKLTGTITKIAQYPEKTPSLTEESLFPFVIEIDDGQEDIIKGTHVKVDIITSQVLDAVTAPAKAIQRQYIYVVNLSGKIEKREITKGLTAGGKVEIESGVEAEQTVLLRPKSIKDGSRTFITPLNLKYLRYQPFTEETTTDLIKYMTVAFLKH